MAKYYCLCLFMLFTIMGILVYIQRGISDDFGIGFSIGLVIGITGIFLLSRNAKNLR